MKYLSKTLPILCLLTALCTGAAAHGRHRAAAAEPSPDLSPIIVQPYVLPTTTDPTHASFLRKMNLENGVFVKGTHWISKGDVDSRDLFILEITQSLEGGFDSVNLYDKGLLSWGLMQWSARSGSLAQALIFIKRELMASGRIQVWRKTFTANGIDVDSAGLIAFGKRLNSPADIRLAFRGTDKVSRFDPKLVNHWATAFARAGRQPAIMELEADYAGHIVDAVLQKRLNGLPYHSPGRNGLNVEDLAGNDPYAEALVFVLWTNNPRHSFEYVADAARAARGSSASDDPALWLPGAFSDALLQRCANSKFGNWRMRSAMIEARALTVRSAPPGDLTPFERRYQTVLAQRKVIRQFELASRHATQQQAARQRAKPSLRLAKQAQIKIVTVTQVKVALHPAAKRIPPPPTHSPLFAHETQSRSPSSVSDAVRPPAPTHSPILSAAPPQKTESPEATQPATPLSQSGSPPAVSHP